MKKKSSFTAFVFILVIAFIFAGTFTIVGVLGWRLLKPALTETSSAETAAPSPKITSRQTAPTGKPPTPPQPPTQKQKPAAAQPGSPALPTSPRERFQLGVARCLSRPAQEYPCGWKDTLGGVEKQFKIEKPREPLVRRVFDLSGRLLSTTAFDTRKKYVILYREGDTTWFFDHTQTVRKIVRSSQSQHSAQDTYYYTSQGKLNSCVCADKTNHCCKRAVRLEPGRNHFCKLFALDPEFCAEK